MMEAAARDKLSKAETFVPLGFGIVCWGIIAIVVGQDVSWDVQNYHLYNGYAYITGRFERDIAPAQIQTYYNPLLDAATYVLIATLPARAVGFAMGAIHGLNFWLIYMIGCTVFGGFSRITRMSTAVVCAVVGTCGVVGLSEVGTLFHDLTTCAFVLGSVLLFLRARFGASPRYELALSGLCVGLGVGLKYTLAPYAVAAAVAIVATREDWRTTARDGLYWAAGGGFGLLLTAGAWMWKLNREFGNPLFPYYNGLFRSPYFEPENVLDDRFVPATVGDAIIFPFRSIGMELAFRDIRYAIVFLLTAIVVVASLIQRIARGPDIIRRSAAIGSSGSWLLLFFFISYGLWQKQFAMYRYTAALEQLAPVLIVLLLSKIVSDGRQLLMVALLPFGIMETYLDVPNWGRVAWRDSFLDVAVPKLPAPAKTTVLLTSSDALSFVIPAFPPAVRFVRVQSNFHGPDRNTKLSDKIAEALRPSDLDYYLLTVSDRLQDGGSVAAIYGFEIAKESCGRIRTNFDGPQNGASPIVFCRLRKSMGVSGTISVSPDPLPLCDATGVAVARLRWSTVGVQAVEVRIGAPDGSIWASGKPADTRETGPWVSTGTTFFLQNASDGNGAGPQKTLAKVVVRTIGGGRCP
jgi:hypothetical protein